MMANTSSPKILELILEKYPGAIQVDISLLRRFPVRTFRHFLRRRGLTAEAFAQECEEKYPAIYAKIISFNIFGCPDSRDIDLVVVVDDIYKPIKRIDLRRLTHDVSSVYPKNDKNKLNTILHTEDIILEVDGEPHHITDETLNLGGDLLDKMREGLLDINYVTLDPTGNIDALSKGSRETQNMVLATYHLHPQKYPILFRNSISFDRIDKVRGIIKYVIDHSEVLTDIAAGNVHTSRRQFYSSDMDNRIDQIATLKIIDTGHSSFTECIKSLVVKCIQLIIYPAGIYTKKQLAAAIPGMESDLLDMLYRMAFHPKTFNSLWQRVLYILDESKLRYKPFYTTALNVIGTKIFTDTLVSEFAKSTLVPTEMFIDTWIAEYKGTWIVEYKGTHLTSTLDTLNELSMTNGHIGTLPLSLHSSVTDRIMMAIPRSPEWLNLLKTYKCGRNSGLVPISPLSSMRDVIAARYNLVRGIIVETAILQKVEWGKIIPGAVPFTIGMIVASTVPGSRGCCPDLLLYTDEGIIVVEIKCIVGNSNSNFERAIDLATKQINTARELLGEASASKGIFALARCIGNTITLELSFL